MAWFGRKVSNKVENEVEETPEWETDLPQVSADLHDPRRAAVRHAIDQGDFLTVRGYLTAAPQDAWWLISGDDTALQDAVEIARGWVQERPEDGWAHFALGALRCSWAWEARGYSYASGVSDEGRRLFKERLPWAEESLHRAAEFLPGNAAPWVGLLRTGRSLRLDLPALEERFQEGHVREPFSAELCEQMTQTLTRKWFGSGEISVAFARWILAEAPVGSAAHGCLALAHVEDSIQAMHAGRDLTDFFRDSSVGADLQRAAERSSLALAPGAPVGVARVRTGNYRAVAVSVGDHDVLAHRVLSVLRGRYGIFPWSLMGEPARRARIAEVFASRAAGTPSLAYRG